WQLCQIFYPCGSLGCFGLDDPTKTRGARCTALAWPNRCGKVPACRFDSGGGGLIERYGNVPPPRGAPPGGPPLVRLRPLPGGSVLPLPPPPAPFVPV